MSIQVPLLRVGEASRRLNLPAHTLRFWERELAGVVQIRRTAGGQRRYTPEQMDLFARVDRLRRGGASLAEIRSFLAALAARDGGGDGAAPREGAPE